MSFLTNDQVTKYEAGVLEKHERSRISMILKSNRSHFKYCEKEKKKENSKGTRTKNDEQLAIPVARSVHRSATWTRRDIHLFEYFSSFCLHTSTHGCGSLPLQRHNGGGDDDDGDVAYLLRLMRYALALCNVDHAISCEYRSAISRPSVVPPRRSLPLNAQLWTRDVYQMYQEIMIISIIVKLRICEVEGTRKFCF